MTGPEYSIRPPRPVDEAEFVELRRESHEFLYPWEPRLSDGTIPSPESCFERLLETSRTEMGRRFVICMHEPLDARSLSLPAASAHAAPVRERIVGQVSLNQIIRGPLQQCFLGYWVAQRYNGRGAATAGIRIALAVAFGPLRLHRVEANIQPQNAPSIAVVRKIGFRREGFSPRYVQINGVWADHERWAMLAEEFTPTAREKSLAAQAC